MRYLRPLILVVLPMACSTTSVVDTAYHGDLSALKAEIEKAQHSGDLPESTVRDLAEAVALRELRAAPSDVAADRVDAIRPCARAVVSGLEERAERHDEGGAHALRALVSLGRVEASSLVTRYANDEDGAWRALSARGSVGKRHARLRHAFIEDRDARVRRAALEAALDAPRSEDFDALFAAARLDPDALARSLAIRSLGALGTEASVLSLVDLWSRADEADRIVIVEAWAQEAARDAGGTARLVRVVEGEAGLVRVRAAAALVDAADGGSADLGREVIVRTVASGSSDERRLAILSVPMDDRGLAALKLAGKDPDRQVQVLALARLLEHTGSATGALERLRSMAAGESDAALQARMALATAGDRHAVGPLKKGLKADSAHARRVAALGLIRLAEWSAGATALADPDASVRLATACAVLNRS